MKTWKRSGISIKICHLTGNFQLLNIHSFLSSAREENFEHVHVFNCYFMFVFFFCFLRLWLLEAIPATGTTAALRFIKEKFQAEDLSVAEAVRTLVAAVHMVKANPESIKLFEVCIQ